MRSNTKAIYYGKEYSAGIRNDGSIILRSSDISDINLGFKLHTSPNPLVKCIKYVERKEIEEVYDIEYIGSYKGYDFSVLEEDGDKVLICATNMDYQTCLLLGMMCVDRGIYQMWVNKNEVKIRIEKIKL